MYSLDDSHIQGRTCAKTTSQDSKTMRKVHNSKQADATHRKYCTLVLLPGCVVSLWRFPSQSHPLTLIFSRNQLAGSLHEQFHIHTYTKKCTIPLHISHKMREKKKTHATPKHQEEPLLSSKQYNQAVSVLCNFLSTLIKRKKKG